ncbi:MAG: enoyl-[acyl-carrier protein] reductase [Acidimicrobiia bacterium]|jgi:enoyl-[acyl-carrier protein] reductase II|nr:enoyl-[acyl-carrier protein] reductase [Acidimicrobiia bacterium]
MDADAILDTELCRTLGIRYPICQAGMGFVAPGRLAAAVSAAGGLGVIGAGSMNARELREEIHVVRQRTDRPFGVDILFAQIKADRNDQVVRYTDGVNRLIEVTLEEQVPVLIAGLGSPAGVVPDAHRQGMVVMALAGNVRQATRMAAEGVDIIIAQGHDAGGHTGRVGTMSLVPQVVDAIDVPVVAAGGIADGRGLVAALALGACGVWMGTRFIASVEALAHDNYKNKILAIDEEGTVVSRCHSGKPCRLIRNRFTDSWEGREDEILPFPMQTIKVGAEAARRARYDGEIEDGGIPAGQSAGLIRSVEPAEEIVRRIVEEARAVLRDRLALA